jgi:hypothetical protein
LQIAWQIKALRTERLVHVFAELWAVLVSLEVDDTIDVSTDIGNDVASENRHWGVAGWVSWTQHHFQLSFGNVRISARGSHVVL